MEEEIFRHMKVDFNKLIDYGFKKENNLYVYSQNIMNNTFKVIIKINTKGIPSGKVFDLVTDEEYTNFRIENISGSYVGQVRKEFKSILQDIKNKCFFKKDFLNEQSNRISQKIEQIYKVVPEFEWEKYPGYAIFRNSMSQKWFGIIMNIAKEKIEEKAKEEVEIINLKVDPNKISKLLDKKGFYKAYHMNKKHWITIILNDTISDKGIIKLVDESYFLTTK